MFYSKTTNGFYDPEINKTTPADVVEISDAEHEAMLDGQTAGMIIVSDASGKPTLTAKQPKSQAEINNDASNTALATLTKLRADIFPYVLTFLATLPGAPMSVKNAAVLAATEIAKVK